MAIPRVDRTIRHLKRYRQIAAVLVKYGFGHILARLDLPARLRLRRTPRPEVPAEPGAPPTGLSAARGIRLACEELGPTFVKLGQILSTRPFLIPYDWLVELALLQDRVAPFPADVARRMLTAELGRPLEEVFASFDEQPVASASLAQVHRATLSTGESVAVKIRRPDIERSIRVDMEILADLAQLIERAVPESRRFRPTAVVAEIARTIGRELDFSREARHLEIFTRNFVDDDTVRLPRLHESLCTERVLVTDFVDGIKITEVDDLRTAGHDLPVTVRSGAAVLLKQIFEHGFFHADPHPGNIFCTPDGALAFVDFGMMGRLPPRAVEELAALLTAVVTDDGDPRALVRALMSLSMLDERTDTRQLETDLADFLDRYRALPLGRVNMRRLFADIFEIVQTNDIHLPTEYMLLAKALITYEEIGRRLDPDYDFYADVAPYARKLIARRWDVGAMTKDAVRSLLDLRDLGDSVMFELRRLAARLRRGDVLLPLEHRGLGPLVDGIDKSANRVSFSLIIAALIVGSSLLVRTDVGMRVFGVPVFGMLGFLFAGILGIWLVIGILRSGRFW